VKSTISTDYGFLRELVFRYSQNILDPSCDSLFDTRLAPLLRERGMARVDELVRHLRARNDPGIEQAVAEAMTIKETSFFRDRRLFELLRTELLPQLINARHSRRSLRMWSAACSTGQEAYSLAMLLDEHFLNCRGAWNIRIEGTDISSEAIEKASRGVYHRIELNRGLSALDAERFFDRAGEDWVLKERIRQLCSFRQLNLCHPVLPFRERFDVILLRNVLLYFPPETRRMLMDQIRRLLASDGILVLGSAEQPPDDGRWRAVLGGGTCHYRAR
jgi:chemotaxis protein methyltransferase CheR